MLALRCDRVDHANLESLVVRSGFMAQFPSTQWSLIVRSGQTPSARHAAFGELASAYRSAILDFFRARLKAQDAEDATQSFLTSSYEHAWWSRADATVGSFRGFLLMLLRRHLGRLRGNCESASDDTAAEAIVDHAPLAEQQFDTRFALVLTARAIDKLRGRYHERSRDQLLEQLLPLLASPPEHGQLRILAETLELPANSLTIELRRLRARLREHLRGELMDLCVDEAAFASEWLAMQDILGGR